MSRIDSLLSTIVPLSGFAVAILFLILSFGLNGCNKDEYKTGITVSDNFISYNPKDAAYDYIKSEACLTSEKFILGKGWTLFTRAEKGDTDEYGVTYWTKPENGAQLRLYVHKCSDKRPRASAPIQLTVFNE